MINVLYIIVNERECHIIEFMGEVKCRYDSPGLHFLWQDIGLWRSLTFAYFGKDINFDGKAGLINAELTDAQYAQKSGDVVYTYENTFDENSQTYANTTYVGVKAKISDGDFFTIQGQPNTMLKTNADIVAVVKTRLRDVINQRIAAINAAIRTSDDATNFPAGVEVTYDVTVTVTEGTLNAEVCRWYFLLCYSHPALR